MDEKIGIDQPNATKIVDGVFSKLSDKLAVKDDEHTEDDDNYQRMLNQAPKQKPRPQTSITQATRGFKDTAGKARRDSKGQGQRGSTKQ